MSQNQDLEEYNALTATLLAFYNYHVWEYDHIVQPRRMKYASLKEEEKKLLNWYGKFTDDLQLCIGINQQFTQSLAVSVANDWGVPSDPQKWHPASANEFEKVRSTLLQLSREWSSDGLKEREIANGRIIDKLVQLFPDESERQNIKIVVPGCGLGRLVVDLVRQGFWCQGNEFSYHMLLTSNFILNHSKFANLHSIMPFLHKSSHVVKRSNQIRPITVPDSTPMDIHELQLKKPEIPYDELMSMTAGSFVDLYGPKDLSSTTHYTTDEVAQGFRETNVENYDVVATTFFLDTAINVIDYIKTIHYCLKPGGLWLNFGPLLWHFEDDINIRIMQNNNEQVSHIMKGLEISRDDLIDLIKKCGFQFEAHESNIESTYSSDVRSLGAFVYKCEYWVCRKI